MSKFLTQYLVVLISFLIIDGLWLAVVARKFYQKYLGYLMTEQVVWWAAVLFYLLFAGAVVYFVVAPAISGGQIWWRVLLSGAILGLAMYATYDLTNQATIKNWPAIVTLVDIIWGTLMTAAVTVISVIILRLFK